MFFKKTENLLSTISSLENEIVDLKQRISDLQIALSKSESELSKKEAFISQHMPFWSYDYSEVQDNYDLYKKYWNKWPSELHGKEYQIQRQKRASEKCYTPLSISPSTGTGKFRGKEKDYSTSLLKCDCTDYQKRQYPCKHMYRLAYELDVFNLDNVQCVTEPQRIWRVQDINIAISKLSRAKLEYLSDLIDNESLIELRNSSNLKALVDNGLACISDLTPNTLGFFRKEDLYSRLPADAKVPKSIKKPALIDLIWSKYPDIIESINKPELFTVQYLN